MNWKQIQLGDLFEQYRIQHIVQDDKDYGQITISKNGYIKFRTTKNGKTIGRKRQFIINLEKYPNTLLFTRQGVSEGAIAFAPKEVNGCIATENMPMFSLKDGISKKFVALLLKSEQYLNELTKLVPTGSAQKSIHERDLMQISLSVPEKEEQNKLSSLIDSRLSNIDVLNLEIETQQILLKKLRQSILQEAIEGKLTASWREQNSGVETASILLEKIKAEKEQLIKDKKIKKPKFLPQVKENEMSFDIPDNWKWCKINELLNDLQYGTSKKCSYSQTMESPILRIPNVSSGYIDTNDLKYTKLTDKEKEQYSLKIDDILVVRSNGSRELVGKSVLVSKELTSYGYAGYLIRLRFFNKKLHVPYIQSFFNSPYIREQIETPLRTTVGINNINSTELSSLIIPIPPFEEQKEIVKIIENLFTICNELETQISSSKTNSQTLMQAVLKEAFEGK